MYKVKFSKRNKNNFNKELKTLNKYVTKLENEEVTDEVRELLIQCLNNMQIRIKNCLKLSGEVVKVNQKLFKKLNNLYVNNDCIGDYIYDENDNLIGYYCYYNFGTEEMPDLRFGWSLVHTKEKNIFSKEVARYIALIRLFKDEEVYKETKYIEKINSTEMPIEMKRYIYTKVTNYIYDDISEVILKGLE